MSEMREQEPFATILAYPKRFAWGIPAVFVISIAAGLAVAPRSLSAGIAVQLLLQTVGLIWLYVPALRRRMRGEGGERDSGPADRRDDTAR